MGEVSLSSPVWMYSYIPGILSVLPCPARVILLATCYWMEETENQTSGSSNNNISSSRSPPCSSVFAVVRTGHFMWNKTHSCYWWRLIDNIKLQNEIKVHINIIILDTLLIYSRLIFMNERVRYMGKWWIKTSSTSMGDDAMTQPRGEDCPSTVLWKYVFCCFLNWSTHLQNQWPRLLCVSQSLGAKKSIVSSEWVLTVESGRCSREAARHPQHQAGFVCQG